MIKFRCFLLIYVLGTVTLHAQEKRMIENPVLTGFNPDPSILRVGVDYYITTYTFFWFPGVQIHHS